MRFIATLFITSFCFGSVSHAETPCDFKGVAVGNRMSPDEIMSAFGVTKYKTNPPRPSFGQLIALSEKYGVIAASELVDIDIGPYCDSSSCRIPYGVTVGNDNTPVKVFVSIPQGVITEINVTFSAPNWNQIVPIIYQKYGAEWNVDRFDRYITNYVSKEVNKVEIIAMKHLTNGINLNTKDRCELSAQNIDMVFEHHDIYGPYHSSFIIKLISKNF